MILTITINYNISIRAYFGACTKQFVVTSEGCLKVTRFQVDFSHKGDPPSPPLVREILSAGVSHACIYNAAFLLRTDKQGHSLKAVCKYMKAHSNVCSFPRPPNSFPPYLQISI